MSMLTFLILWMLSHGVTLADFTATRRPAYVPHLMSENPPEARIVSRTSIFSLTTMRFGSSS